MWQESEGSCPQPRGERSQQRTPAPGGPSREPDALTTIPITTSSLETLSQRPPSERLLDSLRNCGRQETSAWERLCLGMTRPTATDNQHTQLLRRGTPRGEGLLPLPWRGRGVSRKIPVAHTHARLLDPQT